MADISVQFQDGTSHVYKNVPDSVSRDAAIARAQKDFGKEITNISRGALPAVKPTSEESQMPEVPEWGIKHPTLYGIAGAARETLGPILEGAGAIGGSILGGAAGAPAGPAGVVGGGVAGSGLGYGAAKEITGLADVALGNKPRQNLQQQTANALRNVREGMLMEGGGQAAYPVLKTIGKGAESVVSNLIGGLGTHTGAESLRSLARAGMASPERAAIARANLRGEEAMTNVLEDAQAALQTMRASRGTTYREGMENIAGANKELAFKPIEDSFNALEDSYKIDGTWKVGKETQNKLTEIKDVLTEWKNKPELHTTMGFDALKQRIDDLMPSSLEAGQGRRAVSKIRNDVKNIIVKQNPEYAKTMKDYESAIELEREIERALSLGQKASADTAMRKLQSLTRNNVNTNYGNRLQLARALEQYGGANIMDRVAGQAMSSAVPRGLGGIQAGGTAVASMTNPAFLATLPFQSPRLMGEAALASGVAGRKAGQVANALRQRGINQDTLRRAAELGYIQGQQQ